MRILLMGDASNFHRTLATGLRRLGCDVTVASSGSGFMQTARDIDLRRPFKGKAGGLALWLRLNGPLRGRLKGYDIVSLSNCNFLELKPERVRTIFHRLKNDNGAVFLTALGTDLPYIEECLDPDGKLRYNEFLIGGQASPFALEHPEIIPAWQSSPLRDWCDEFYAGIDGAVSALYEYHVALRRRLAPDKIAYGGIPIDVSALSPVEIPVAPSPVRIFLGRHRHRMSEKGTDRFETAIRRALEQNPGKGELVIVENRPYDEYVSLMRSAHLIVDQAYSYTPATNALLSMAYGIPTVSGGEPAFYDFIENLPSSPYHPSTSPDISSSIPSAPPTNPSFIPSASPTNPSSIPSASPTISSFTPSASPNISASATSPHTSSFEVPIPEHADGSGCRLIPFNPARPVLNSPTDIEGMTAMFSHILRHPEILHSLGVASRRFVETNNTCEIVASRFLSFWAKQNKQQ